MPTPPQARVLIVDNSRFMRLTLRGPLEAAGYECLEASDGQEALEAYEAQKPDVVFMDITMERMDGLTALARLRERHPEARVVMCSAMGTAWHVERALQAGAADYLVKPFTKERLLAAAANALSFRSAANT